MTLGEQERNAAHGAALRILDRAGLADFLFQLDDAGTRWLIHVEHPFGGAWRHTTLTVGRTELLSALDDRHRRDAIAADWHRTLFRLDAA